MSSKPQPQKGTEPEVPYDPTDPSAVADRQKASKRREDERAEGLRHIMASRMGRAWMRHLLGEKLFTRVGKRRPAPMFTGSSATFYNAALREVGDIIASELAALCPAEMRLMEDEGD